MTIFKDNFGENKPLNLNLSYRDMKIDFIRDKSTIKITMILKLAVFHDFVLDPALPKDELLYDEIPFSLEGTASISSGKMYLTLINWSLNHAHGSKHYPHRNSMNISQNDYVHFLS